MLQSVPRPIARDRSTFTLSETLLPRSSADNKAPYRRSARERAIRDGVVCYLSKPFEENDLLACIQSSLYI